MFDVGRKAVIEREHRLRDTPYFKGTGKPVGNTGSETGRKGQLSRKIRKIFPGNLARLVSQSRSEHLRAELGNFKSES